MGDLGPPFSFSLKLNKFLSGTHNSRAQISAKMADCAKFRLIPLTSAYWLCVNDTTLSGGPQRRRVLAKAKKSKMGNIYWDLFCRPTASRYEN